VSEIGQDNVAAEAAMSRRVLEMKDVPSRDRPQLLFLNFEVLNPMYSLIRSKNDVFTKIRHLYTVKTSVLWQRLYSVIHILHWPLGSSLKISFFFIMTPTCSLLTVKVWYTDEMYNTVKQELPCCFTSLHMLCQS
jgi:hypothetical protein